jgi:hypothetical protein
MKLLEELVQPVRLSHSINDDSLLSLNTSVEDHEVTLRGPKDVIGLKNTK